MATLPDTYAASFNANKLDAAAGADAVITIAAVADRIHVVDAIYYSFSAAPASIETLTVAYAGVTLWQIDIPAAAVDFDPIIFPRGLFSRTANQAVVITLTGTGGAQVAKVNVSYRTV